MQRVGFTRKFNAQSISRLARGFAGHCVCNIIWRLITRWIFIAVIAQQLHLHKLLVADYSTKRLSQLLIGCAFWRVQLFIQRRQMFVLWLQKYWRNSYLNSIGPHIGRPQKTFWKFILAVNVSQKRLIRALRKQLAQHGINHRVKHQVVQRRGAREQARVAKHHVVQLMHGQHHKFFRSLRVLRNPFWIN